jgi:hypothetical protein
MKIANNMYIIPIGAKPDTMKEITAKVLTIPTLIPV